MVQLWRCPAGAGLWDRRPVKVHQEAVVRSHAARWRQHLGHQRRRCPRCPLEPPDLQLADGDAQASSVSAGVYGSNS